MNTDKKRVTVLALTCLFVLLSGCKKEPKPIYKPYDFDLSSYVRLGDLLHVTYVPLVTDVTEDDVTVRICEELNKVGLYRTVLADYRHTDIQQGEVKQGDTVRFSCTATVDGNPFADATVDGQTVTVGRGQVNLDGFDTAMVGIPIGQETPLTLYVPSDYRDFSLREKEVLLTVTVEQVEERLTCPEPLTEECLTAVKQTEETAYRASIREQLQGEKEEASAMKRENDCWQAALKEVTLISYPQVELERYVDTFLAYTEEEGKKAGFETLTAYREHLGLSEQQLRDVGMKYARWDVLQEMVVYAVARNEGFDKMSDELFQRYALPMAKELGLSSAEELTDVVGYYEVQKRVLTKVVKEYIAQNGTPLLPEPEPTPEETPSP